MRVHEKSLADTGNHRPLFDGAFLKKACLAVTLIVALLFAINVAGRWIGKRIATGGQSVSTETIAVTLGEDHLSLTANTIRFASQRQGGETERVDLYLSWPDMEGYTSEKKNLFDDPDQTGSVIFLQLSRSTMSRDMSGRLEHVYRGLFEGEPQKLRYGLTLHRLRENSGYGNEVIITGKNTTGPDYAVRCIFPSSGTPATGGDCQRDIHIGKDLSVLYRFSSTHLAEWQQIEDNVRTYVSQRLAP